MSDTQPLEVLLLYDSYRWSPGTVLRHIRALSADSRHRVRPLGHVGDLPRALELARFDAVVIHYSVFIFDRGHLSTNARDRLRAFEGVKAVFIQDEHRHIDLVIDALKDMAVDLLFTCVPEGEADKVYPPDRLPHLRKVTVLTGYLDEALASREVPAWEARSIDVGYRARKLPPWLGTLGREKWIIGQRFARDAATYGLRCDISMREEDRLYGEAWIQFVSGCKAVLGSESGASVFDFDGEIATRVEAHMRREPGADFDILRDRYFAAADGAIDSAVISPRCFEAAALRTLMILYEGRYSGILTAGRHFVPLKKDHSNMAEIVELLRSPDRAREIIDTAYTEIAQNRAYAHGALTSAYDAALEAAATDRAKQPAYSPSEFDGIERRHRWRLAIRRGGAYVRFSVSRIVLGGVLAILGERQRDQVAGALRRIYRRATAPRRQAR